MKVFVIIIVLFIIISSCYSSTEVQTEISFARVIKVEPHYYYMNESAWVTFEDEHKNIFVARVKIEDTSYYKVGLIIPALMRK